MTRQNYMMTQRQYDALIYATEPQPLIMLQCGYPSQQERANRAWERLGAEMGFKHMSAAPGEDGKLSFTAEPMTAVKGSAA